LNNSEQIFLRRKEAAAYLQETYRFCSRKTLDKIASVGGGPAFRKIGRIVVYEKGELDRWATEKMGEPRLSTSDLRGKVKAS
jgi:hypothetical protein